jgi:hypothetical protein
MYKSHEKELDDPCIKYKILKARTQTKTLKQSTKMAN